MPPKILLSIADLQRITEYSYDNAAREHKAIRDALGCKRHLTIKQYCEYEGLPFDQILDFLTGKSGHPRHDL